VFPTLNVPSVFLFFETDFLNQQFLGNFDNTGIQTYRDTVSNLLSSDIGFTDVLLGVKSPLLNKLEA